VEGLDGKELMIRDLKRKIRDLEAENSSLQEQIDVMAEKRDAVQYCLDETRKSFSYRMGYALTAIPRKVRTLLKK